VSGDYLCAHGEGAERKGRKKWWEFWNNSLDH